MTEIDMKLQPNTQLKTYQLRWEPIQEFELPEDCICTSLSVNPVMGEILFACRNRGLLHYALSKDHGVVYANKPCRVSYSDWGNVRLVTCEDSGNYAVVNDQTLALVMIGYQRKSTMQTGPMTKISMLESEPGTMRLGVARRAESAKESSAVCDCVDFESERCVVGDVRDVAIDTENERIYLLYRDKLCRRIFPDMRHYNAAMQSPDNRCIGSELVCLAQGRKLLYVLTKRGDIKVRLKLERMTDVKDQLAWRSIGCQLSTIVPSSQEYKKMAREIAKLKHRREEDDCDHESGAVSAASTAAAAAAAARATGADVLAARRHKIVADIDSSGATAADCSEGEATEGGGECESSDNLVELASACVDTRRNMLFAATGRPGLYAMWQVNSNQDTGSAGWRANWLHDYWLNLEGPPLKKPLFPGAVACTGTSARRPGYLYVIDRKNCRRVIVIRYSTEQTSVAAFSGESNADATGGAYG